MRPVLGDKGQLVSNGLWRGRPFLESDNAVSGHRVRPAEGIAEPDQHLKITETLAKGALHLPLEGQAGSTRAGGEAQLL